MSQFYTRKALPSERVSIMTFVFDTHVHASSRNEEERQSQIDDLPTDFPYLVDDTLFTAPTSHVLITVDATTDELVGVIGIFDQQPPTAIPAPSAPSSSSSTTDNNTNTRGCSDSDCIVPSSDIVEEGNMRSAKLSFFFVKDTYRGQHIGTALLTTALNDAHTRGINYITLVSLREVYDTAIHVYTKHRFKVVREYPGGSYTLVDMALSL